jgi:type VII secretion protein EccB
VHSRRDQIEAHAFVVNRMRSALVSGEPDRRQSPLNRTLLGLLLSAVVGLVAVGAVAVLALLSPGSSPGWRKPGTLIVEKQTGTRYVFSGDRLHPVINYASARLLLGQKLTVASVSSKTLAKVPRGGQVGIAAAPDALPSPARAGDQPWSACATRGSSGSGGAGRDGVTLLLGGSISPPADPRAAAVLVAAPDGTQYLVENGRRMRLAVPWAARALGYEDAVPLPVRNSWLDVVPAGPDLASVPVDGRGSPGPVVDGQPTTVGQVVGVEDAAMPNSRYYVVQRGGLMPVSTTGTALVLGDPATAAAYPGGAAHTVSLTPTALAGASLQAAPDWVRELPAVPPALPSTDGKVPCVVVTPHDARATYALALVPETGLADSPVQVPGASRTDESADVVSVPPGGGALVRPLAAPGSTGSGLFLVVENGVKYPVADDQAATALGYASGSAGAVPAALLRLLPTGPELSSGGGGT